MTDQQMWENAVRVVMAEYDDLAEPVKARVGQIGASIRQIKLEIFSLAEQSAGVETCAACAGLCCEKGKYHFSVIDLLVYLSADRELFAPSFRETPCPFLGERGCLMDPAYRPFPCITFHCELLESPLSAAELERMYLLERSLRASCRQMEELFGNRLMQGLLLSYERSLAGAEAAILSRFGGC